MHFSTLISVLPLLAGMTSAQRDCQYYIRYYSNRNCEGPATDTYKIRNTDCQAGLENYGSFILNPVQNHCQHGHVQFFNGGDKKCSGSLQFDSDFRGRVCMTPKPNHHFNSVIIRNY